MVCLHKSLRSLHNLGVKICVICRNANQCTLLVDCLQYALANPPDGVGYKLKSASRVEALSGSYQADVAFIHEVFKAQNTLAVEVLGYRNHKTQVRIHELFQVSIVVSFAVHFG